MPYSNVEKRLVAWEHGAERLAIKLTAQIENYDEFSGKMKEYVANQIFDTCRKLNELFKETHPGE